MTESTTRSVIDASVAVKLFVEEPLSEKAHLLFSRLGHSPDVRFFVPGLFYAECANALWKLVRRHRMPPADARRHVAALGRLRLDRIATVTLLGDALAIALEHDVTVYDACYVAASRLVEAPLITSDERLVAKLGDMRGQVIHLADSAG